MLYGLGAFCDPREMTILTFDNGEKEPLILVLEPADEEYSIPHLATAGVRLMAEDGVEQRFSCTVDERRIALWCDSPNYEVEIVYPSPFDLLLRDICVRLGYCGGIVDDAPCIVDDLLPSSGTVTARQFAEAAIRADGDSPEEPMSETRIGWLEEAFARFFDPAGVPAESLRRNLRLPFESVSEDAEPLRGGTA